MDTSMFKMGRLKALGCLSLGYICACSNLLTQNGDLGVYAPADEIDSGTFVKEDSGPPDRVASKHEDNDSGSSGPVDASSAHDKVIDSGVSSRVDAGLDDGSKIANSKGKQCEPKESASCNMGNGVTLPEDKEVDLSGNVQLFAKGATLPAGKYRLSYVDGCNMYSGLGTVRVSGKGSCVLVDENGTYIADTPGTAGSGTGGLINSAGVFTFPTYSTYDECVAANCEQPPLDFDFAGGKLGVEYNRIFSAPLVSFGVIILAGESEGGRSPTFRLTRLDPCP